MSKKLLKCGDRIRLKVRTIGGWKGIGIVTADQRECDEVISFRQEDDPANDRCLACRHEVAKIRQIMEAKEPNPLS